MNPMQILSDMIEGATHIMIMVLVLMPLLYKIYQCRRAVFMWFMKTTLILAYVGVLGMLLKKALFANFNITPMISMFGSADVQISLKTLALIFLPFMAGFLISMLTPRGDRTHDNQIKSLALYH